MEDLRPKQLAQEGVSYIEEAILDLLFETEINTQQGLGPTEISRRLGTFLSGSRGNYPRDIIVAGFLFKLKEQGLVNNVVRGNWRLSEIEREKRFDEGSRKTGIIR